MSTIKKIVKNTGILFIAQIINYVLGFFFTVYTARYLGAEGFGILSLALALTGIFQIFADLGFSKLITRDIARDKSLTNKYVGNITLIKIIASIFTFLLIILTTIIMGYSSQITFVIYLIALYTIFTTFTQILYGVFQAYEILKYQALGIIINAFLLLFGALYLIYHNAGIIEFGYLYLVTSLTLLIYNIVTYLLKFGLPKFEIDSKLWKLKIMETWPFAVTGISINMYYWVDSILISLLIGEAAVGWYNAAYKLIIVLLVIPITLNAVIFPLMSKYHVSSKKSLKVSFEKYFKIMIFVGIPIGIGTTLISDKIILLIYGSQFINAVIILQILIWSLVFTFMRSPFENLLQSTNKQVVVTKIFIIGVIFNIITNLLIIPTYGYVGAAIVTVLTDILIISLLIKATSNFKLLSKTILIESIKIITASIIMGIIISFIIGMNIFLIIIISSFIYLLLSLALKILNEREILIIKSTFNKNYKFK